MSERPSTPAGTDMAATSPSGDTSRSAADGKTDDCLFDAILTPHRSLSPAGFVILMSLVALVGFGTGIVFLTIGAWREWTFQPYWLRVVMDDPPQSESRLVLTSHGESLVIGSFLTPEERLDLAKALRRALAAAREMPAG